MAHEERYPLIFDKEIVRISIEAAKKRGENISVVGHGASVIINHEFEYITVFEDNILVMYSAGYLFDPYYPVIDMERKIVVGAYFSEQPFFHLYTGQSISKGTKIEFGRYLCFVPNWRIVHIAVIGECGKSGSALLVQN